MEELSDQNNQHQEDGEEQLAILISQAGEEARARKREALDRHFKRIQEAIAEGMSRRQKPIPK